MDSAGPGVRQSSAALAGNGMRKDAAFGPATGSGSRERERTRALQDAAALILDRIAPGVGVSGL